MLRNHNPNNSKGFTLVEMMVVAPTLILIIGIFIAAIISITGSVMASRGANKLTYDIQDALTRIEGDVKVSSAFLTTNSVTLTSPQGYDDNTQAFQYNDPTNGPELILSIFATTSNPLTSTQNIVYKSGLPYACNDPQVNKNPPLVMNVVYFVKSNNGTKQLWRRVLAQSDYATVGCVSGSIAAPWQQPTCAPTQTGSICKTNDELLADLGATGSISISYFTAGITPTADPTVANAVSVTINGTNTYAGRDVTRSSTVRAFRNDMTSLYKTVDILVIGGGGGGGGANSNQRAGGGGGAGGFIYNTGVQLTVGNIYSITVGGSGGGGAALTDGGTGGDSIFGSLFTAKGGGGGGRGGDAGVDCTGNSGGSGGGAGGSATHPQNGGSNIAGLQGYIGGNDNDGNSTASGGGGGAGGSGGNASSTNVGGAAGAGLSNSITGAAVTYAAGGPGRAGGVAANGANATTNTGNGAQGGQGVNAIGGNGGSGIVIIRFVKGSLNYTTTGTVTVLDPVTINSVNYVVLEFTTGTGSFTITA